MRDNVTTLTGNPRIDFGLTRLTADEITYNQKTQIAVARGHAVLTSGPRRLLADVITYHVNDGTFAVENFRMGEYPFYVQGASASGNRETITMNDADAWVREPGPFIPTLHAGELSYANGEKLHAQKGTVGLGNVRPVFFDKFQQNLNEPLISYVSFNGGYRSSLGAFGEAGLHIPVANGLKLGGDLGVYTSRGVMFGPSGSYESPKGADDYRGYFRSGFISDHGDRLTDILGRPIPKNRGYVEWQHEQHPTENLSITGQLNYWKDSDVLRDFKPKEFFQVQQPDTFLETVYTTDNSFSSLFARFQPNSFQDVQERLPELRYDLLPSQLGAGFYQKLNSSIAILREDPPLAPTLRSDRFDAYYGLSRPFKVDDYLSFTPVAGGRLTYYSDATGGRNEYTRALGEVGFDAALRTSAVYDYRNELWKIDGIRHLFTPTLSYRYIPEADKGRAYIPPIDRRVFSTYLQPLGLGDVRNIDDLAATDTLRVGLNNTIQTRDPAYGSRDLFVLNFASDFRFHRQPGERDVSEIHTEFAAMPARWVEFNLYQSFAPQTFTLRELNSGVTFRDGKEWTVRFSSNFLRHELEDYLVDVQKKLTEAYDIVGRIHYDARKRRFVEQSYGIRQNLGNTWRAEYVVTLYNGPRRESNFGFNIQIEAIGF